jgi:hypothetical protein
MIRRRLYRNLSLNFDLTRSTFGCPCSWRDDRPILGVVSKGLLSGNKEDVLSITSCEFHIVGHKKVRFYQGWKRCSLKYPCNQYGTFPRRILRTLPERAPNCALLDINASRLRHLKTMSCVHARFSPTHSSGQTHACK